MNSTEKMCLWLVDSTYPEQRVNEYNKSTSIFGNGSHYDKMNIDGLPVWTIFTVHI